MKKVIVIILAVCFVISLTGCGTSESVNENKEYEAPAETNIGNIEWNAVSLDAKQALGELTYSVPSMWNSAEAKSPKGFYYYPYSEKNEGLLYVSYQEVDGIEEFDINDKSVFEPLLDGTINGMTKDGELLHSKYMMVQDFPSATGECILKLGEVDYRTIFCIILTGQFCYSFLYAEPSALPDGAKGFFESLVESVEVELEVPAATIEPKARIDTTMGQQNALRAAKAYLDYAAFSYSGLIQQLEFEKYSHEDAVYAADNCGADWNEQAEKAAKAYLDYMAFSRDGLIEQLEFEGYTHEQAVYGVEANGY